MHRKVDAITFEIKPTLFGVCQYFSFLFHLLFDEVVYVGDRLIVASHLHIHVFSNLYRCFSGNPFLYTFLVFLIHARIGNSLKQIALQMFVCFHNVIKTLSFRVYRRYS